MAESEVQISAIVWSVALIVAQVAGSSSVASAGVGGGGVPIWPLRGLYDAQELR
jgi:hypothetical protein